MSTAQDLLGKTKKMNGFVIRPVVININTADSVLNAEFVYDISEVLCHIIHVTYMMAVHCLGTLKPISLVHRRYSVLTKWATRAKDRRVLDFASR